MCAHVYMETFDFSIYNLDLYLDMFFDASFV